MKGGNACLQSEESGCPWGGKNLPSISTTIRGGGIIAGGMRNHHARIAPSEVSFGGVLVLQQGESCLEEREMEKFLHFRRRRSERGTAEVGGQLGMKEKGAAVIPISLDE